MIWVIQDYIINSTSLIQVPQRLDLIWEKIQSVHEPRSRLPVGEHYRNDTGSLLKATRPYVSSFDDGSGYDKDKDAIPDQMSETRLGDKRLMKGLSSKGLAYPENEAMYMDSPL